MSDATQATRTTVTIGPIEVDGFMLLDGSYQYRMCKTQSAQCMGEDTQNILDFLRSETFKSSTGKDGTTQILEIILDDDRQGGQTRISTLPLEIVREYWLQQAGQGNKRALILVRELTIEKLEERFDGAFDYRFDEFDLFLLENGIDPLTKYFTGTARDEDLLIFEMKRLASHYHMRTICLTKDLKDYWKDRRLDYQFIRVEMAFLLDKGHLCGFSTRKEFKKNKDLFQRFEFLAKEYFNYYQGLKENFKRLANNSKDGQETFGQLSPGVLVLRIMQIDILNELKAHSKYVRLNPSERRGYYKKRDRLRFLEGKKEITTQEQEEIKALKISLTRAEELIGFPKKNQLRELCLIILSGKDSDCLTDDYYKIHQKLRGECEALIRKAIHPRKKMQEALWKNGIEINPSHKAPQ